MGWLLLYLIEFLKWVCVVSELISIPKMQCAPLMDMNASRIVRMHMRTPSAFLCPPTPSSNTMGHQKKFTSGRAVAPHATFRPFVGTIAPEYNGVVESQMERTAQKWFEAELEDNPPIDHIVAPSCIFTDKLNGWVFRGREAIKERMIDFNRAFPDFELSVLDIMVNNQGRTAACHWAGTGTNLGCIADQEPTGVRSRFSGVHLFTFSPDGKIIDVIAYKERASEEQKFEY